MAPLIDTLKAGGPAGETAKAELRKILHTRAVSSYSTKISEYARKYNSECVAFLRQVLAAARRGSPKNTPRPRRRDNSKNASEYSLLRKALGVIRSSAPVDEKRKSLSKLLRSVRICIWAIENPTAPSVVKNPYMFKIKGFSPDMYKHGYSLVKAMQHYLEFDELYRILETGIEKEKPFSGIKRAKQHMQGHYDEAVNALAAYPDDAGLPEIAEMKNKLESANASVEKYQNDIENGTLQLRKYRREIDAAGDVKTLEAIWVKMRVFKSEINTGVTIKYSDEKLKKKVIDAVDEMIANIRSKIKDIKAGVEVKQPSRDMEILWLDDVRDPLKYFKKDGKTASETFTRNKNFYAKLF